MVVPVAAVAVARTLAALFVLTGIGPNLGIAVTNPAMSVERVARDQWQNAGVATATEQQQQQQQQQSSNSAALWRHMLAWRDAVQPGQRKSHGLPNLRPAAVDTLLEVPRWRSPTDTRCGCTTSVVA